MISSATAPAVRQLSSNMTVGIRARPLAAPVVAYCYISAIASNERSRDVCETGISVFDILRRGVARSLVKSLTAFSGKSHGIGCRPSMPGLSAAGTNPRPLHPFQYHMSAQHHRKSVICLADHLKVVLPKRREHLRTPACILPGGLWRVMNTGWSFGSSITLAVWHPLRCTRRPSTACCPQPWLSVNSKLLWAP